MPAGSVLLATAAAQSDPPGWVFALVGAGFPAFWVAVLTILGHLSGHHELLARFPPVSEPLEASFGWASGRIRGIDFNSALHVGIGARGLHLAANALFRPPFARGIPCIPWHEIRLVRPAGHGILTRLRGSRFEVRSLGLSFKLQGRAARAVERKLGGAPHGLVVH